MDKVAEKPILTDEEIVNGFRTNNQDIIVSVYKIIIPNVKAFVMTRGGAKEDAENVAWRAITKFWQRCQKAGFELKDQNTGFGAYISRAYRNVWMDLQREGEIKQKKETIEFSVETQTEENDELTGNSNTISKGFNVERFADESKLEETLALKNAANLIWQLVNRLIPKCRDFFNLYYRKELTYDEIAEIKKVSAGAIRKQKVECKEPFMQELMKSKELKELISNYPELTDKILNYHSKTKLS
ncbi:MAG: sigma-70 family RNA polymerase sigma factor [Sphingobacteriales bacterium]|nr:MAG: sigma-70 family RNA polymerase sigma factor [Sphingobacteriales bacterium]